MEQMVPLEILQPAACSVFQTMLNLIQKKLQDRVVSLEDRVSHLQPGFILVQPDPTWFSMDQPVHAWSSLESDWSNLVQRGSARISIDQPGLVWISLVQPGPAWFSQPCGFPVPQCDQVMEFSWSALWNITDETPDNCQMFLNCHGMSLFLECLEVSRGLHT